MGARDPRTEVDGLAEPEVAPSVYDRDYFRTMCAGHGTWVQSGGADASPRYEQALRRAGLGPGDVVVDIGTGRGELLAIAVELGAARAVGVDYSPDGVELARETLAARGATDRAEVIQADARATPIDGDFADLVTMLDVVEHLAPAELDATLKEALRVLKPGGRLIVHTAPNRLVYDVTYRLVRALHPRARRKWSADPRHPLEYVQHVNEQSPRSLRRALRRSRFEKVSVRTGSRVGPRRMRHGRARYLARVPLVRLLVVLDIWAEARKPPAL